jgi:hypothetical protein
MEFKSIKNMVIKRALEIGENNAPEIVNKPDFAASVSDSADSITEENNYKITPHNPDISDPGVVYEDNGNIEPSFSSGQKKAQALEYLEPSFAEKVESTQESFSSVYESKPNHNPQHKNEPAPQNNYSPLVKLLANMLQERYTQNYHAFTDKNCFLKSRRKI